MKTAIQTQQNTTFCQRYSVIFFFVSFFFSVPRNTEEIKSVGQNETSVTLQWKKVEHILTYTLGFSGGEINVTALVEDELVTHTIPDLSSGTEYSFSLVTVFASVKSSGVNHTAVTGKMKSLTTWTMIEPTLYVTTHIKLCVLPSSSS